MLQHPGEIGNLQRDSNRLEEARVAFHKALQIQEKVLKAHPTNPQFRGGVAATCTNLGNLELLTNHLPEALEYLQKACQLRKELAAANPTVVEFQHLLAGCYNNIGLWHFPCRVSGSPSDFTLTFHARPAKMEFTAGANQ